jgi:PAS domain S-box-containing protein
MKHEEIPPKISATENANKTLLSDEEISPYWLAALIDSADDAIISKTLDGIITSWNKGAERIFGYTADEVIGKPILILIPHDHHNEEPEILRRIRAGERVEHYETVRARKDGSLVDISLTISPIKKPDGKIIGASKIARDISALKHAERTLRHNETQLRLITDAIPALVSYVDDECRYRFVNHGYNEWFGRPLDEFIGKHLVEIIGEAAYATVQPYIEKVLDGEECEFEQLIPYLEGERIVHVNYIPDFDEETGKVKGFCALVQDVSESKKAEAQLRESEARFAKAFSSSPLVLTISSLDTGKLLEVNETFVTTTGISREEAIGKTTVELGLWAQPTDREQEMETVRRDGHIRNAEYLFNTRKGEIVGLLSAEHIEIGGESFALTVIQDITARKRAEREREEFLFREQIARRQAEEASRLKDEFLATVSHEIRTPLNAILGWSQMLKANKISNPNDIRGAVETIYRNAKSQAQLIEDILDVSRIITGKIRLEAHPISLAPVIQTAVESLRPAIEAKNIRLQMHLDFEPRMVVADPNRLQQVVWNLLSNAIKFTPENGSVEISLENESQQTKIVVTDTGKGIEAEFLPFVFERFRQADGSSTRKHGGLGLGLAIVRHIVELHGGSVEVSSAGEGHGATFTVLLPQTESVTKKIGENAFAAVASEAQDAVSDYSNGKIKGLRVLLIDDETDTLELLSVLLTQSGAEIKSATSVADAFEVIKDWKPGVIVSDIAMPVEDGYSFIKKLRALPHEDGGAIPAIALTAYVGIKERTQVLASGFQMYVPKPVEPSELVGALANFA